MAVPKNEHQKQKETKEKQIGKEKATMQLKNLYH